MGKGQKKATAQNIFRYRIYTQIQQTNLRKQMSPSFFFVFLLFLLSLYFFLPLLPFLFVLSLFFFFLDFGDGQLCIKSAHV